MIQSTEIKWEGHVAPVQCNYSSEVKMGCSLRLDLFKEAFNFTRHSASNNGMIVDDRSVRLCKEAVL
jgi:hypothetical protein